jgi:GMP synthase-like glutamine amidotransferase
MRALIIANKGDDDPGHVGERLRDHGFELQVGHRDQNVLPENLDGFDLLVLLGSDWSVYWEHVRDDVDRESNLVRQAAEQDLPVLAICYGAQLLSHALGGSVERAHCVEIGWYDIATSDDALIPPGPWFEYHIDKFTPPDGAEVLAQTPAGPQAYRLGRMLALQFHPEVNSPIIRSWGDSSPDDAVKYGVDFESVYAQSDELQTDARTRAHNLVDAFLTQVAGVTATAGG